MKDAVKGTRAPFGALLRSHRRAAGMTQEILAERAGYSAVYISMLERGERRPQPEAVQHLCAALGLSAFDQSGFLLTLEADSAPSVVGRQEELELLTRHLSGEGPPVMLLAGEPGIGKTRLLREAKRMAQIQGWRVLEGGCGRRGGQEPLEPLLGALERYARDQVPDRLHAELEGCVWLARLLPELRDHVTVPPSLALAQERRLMLDALARFLGQIRGPAGTLLLLDDLQWAGADALDALYSLLETGAPVRIVAAYRDIEVPRGSPLSVLIGDLALSEWVIHRALSPLTTGQADELFDSLLSNLPAPDPTLREWALRQAGGVPFFVVSFAQEVVSGAETGRHPKNLPWNVAQGIRRRVAALPAPASEILAIAAVAGRSISTRLLADVMSVDAGTLVEALDGICRARLLVDDGANGYKFSHDVIREVLEADLGAARRSDLHRRVADALEPAQAVDVLAYHYTHCGQADKATQYLEMAGDQARERYAHASAATYYRELATRLEAAGRSVHAAAVREKLGSVLMAGGQYDAALETLAAAAGVYQDQRDRERELLVAAQIARVHERRGTPAEGIDWLERLRVTPHADMAHAEAEMDVVLASLFLVTGRYAEQLDAAERAARRARELNDDRLLAEAEVWRGCALNQLGRLDEGRAVHQAAIPLADKVGDITSLSHALNDMGFITEVGGEFTTSRHYKDRALQLAERAGDPLTIATMAFRCGQNAFLRGDWREAERLFLRGVRTSQSLGTSSISAYPPFGLALLAFARKDTDRARQHGAETLKIAAKGDHQAERAALILLAECDLRDGAPEEAMKRLERAGPDGDGLGLYPAGPVLAAALLALGRRAEARQAATQAVSLATERRHRVALVDALRVQGIAADVDSALCYLDQALDLAGAMGYFYGELRVLETRALLISDSADDERAEQARQRLGMGPSPSGHSTNRRS